MPTKMDLFCYLVLIFFISTCSNHVHKDSLIDTLRIDQVSAIEIEREFRISEFNENESFGYISSIVTGSDETIFVSDPSTRKINLFDKRGSYIGFLGGYGGGPGEFERISNMSLLSPDTLQIVDISSARVTFYSLTENGWSLAKTIDYPMSPHIDTEIEIFGFRQFHSITDGYIGVFESTISSFNTSTDNFIMVCFVLYDRNLQSNDEYKPLCYNKLELIVYQSSESSEQTISAMPVPEGYETLFAVSADGDIITTWTEHPILSIQPITQTAPKEFEYNSAKIPITSEYKSMLAKQAIPNEEHSYIKHNQVINAIPSYKGFAEQMLVDDKDRIWVLTHPVDNDDPEWLIYNFKGNLIGRMFHPGGNLTQIKNNKIYVSHNSGEEEPAFSVYSIEE